MDDGWHNAIPHNYDHNYTFFSSKWSSLWGEHTIMNNPRLLSYNKDMKNNLSNCNEHTYSTVFKKDASSR